MRHTILIFSAIAVSLLILLNLRRLSILSAEGDEELWTVLFALAFLGIGITLSRYLFRPQTTLKSEETTDGEAEMKKLGITLREYEVLRLVAKGHSNLEISKALFISESTVKTHVSNVLLKLDAKRRTQAVQKAKELGVL
jgi:DNA-binding CsgD family transcriptional regulator